jgi:hypothetical protein
VLVIAAEDDAGDVQPRERHRCAGDRLVAADEADELSNM